MTTPAGPESLETDTGPGDKAPVTAGAFNCQKAGGSLWRRRGRMAREGASALKNSKVSGLLCGSLRTEGGWGNAHLIN